MTVTDSVSAGGVRIRVRPWRGRTDTAECVTAPVGSLVTRSLVDGAVGCARDRGYEIAVTPALPPYEWRPYLDAGFTERERLHLLGHDLLDFPDLPVGDADVARLRRVGRRDMARVVAIDNAAFQPFWRLDAVGLTEASRATPSSRLRMTTDRAAYALIGRAGDRGYIQRLAVDPDAQGRGLGTALVLDGLRWLRRWRVREALVNTQVTNTRAVALYERLGFRFRPGGLAVLHLDLTGDVASRADQDQADQYDAAPEQADQDRVTERGVDYL